MKPKTLAVLMEIDGGLRKGFEEKRRYQRLTTHVHGQILYTAGSVEIEVCDLSKSGARLKPVTAPHSLPRVGDTLDLVLTWPIPTETESLHVEAVVVRSGADDIAVEFSHLGHGAGPH